MKNKNILYHCTSKSLKDSILKEGLKIENALSKTGHIYLSKNPEYCYGDTCFSVNVYGLNIEQTENIWEYICKESISSDRIKYYGFKEVE